VARGDAGVAVAVAPTYRLRAETVTIARMRYFLASFVLGVLGLASPSAARACGGGLVSTQGSLVNENVQRIFISVRGGNTDVVTQVGVPSTTADYGVLIPTAAQPTLDSTPVASSELDNLDHQTAPQIMMSASDANEGFGCSCPTLGGGSTKSNTGGAPAEVSTPVAIGPVTAVVITGDTGDAINAWLAQNGFMIPAASQSIVDAYAGPGRFFIAIRRNDTAAIGGASSVGVHFTMPGDQRALPLGFARLGAADTVAFTALVAADQVVVPAAPFEALTLDDLSGPVIRSSGYARAMQDAVSARGGRAFVIEGSWTGSSLGLGGTIGGLIAPDSWVTRLSTILPAASLSGDALLNQTYAGSVPRTRYVEGEASHAPVGFAMMALLVLRRRRRGR